MRLLVIGATKGIGAAVRDEALARGHSVRAFARSADQLAARDGLEPWAGDATRADQLTEAVTGCDAVISALGVDHNLAMLWKEVTLFSRSTSQLLQAMGSAGVRRLVAVTGFGSGDSKAAMSSLERAGHWALLGRPYADKDRQEALIRDSETDWTLVRPVILTNGPKSGTYRVLSDPKTWRNGLISRADVADFVVAEVETGAHRRQAVVLAR